MARLDKAEGAALLERFHRYLREHHQPVTRQRDLVAQVVFRSEDHLSVDAIRRQLKHDGERVGTATVYRTLDLLVESGLVRAHQFGEGFKRYEPVAAQADHEHLICERCGKVAEFEYDDDFGGQRQPVHAEVYLFCYVGSHWALEYRFTTPKTFDAGNRIAAFMKGLSWTVAAGS